MLWKDGAGIVGGASEESEASEEYEDDLECEGGELEDMGDDGGEFSGDVDSTNDVVAIA